MLQIWYIEADREKIFISVQHFCCGKRKEDHIAYVWTLRLNEQEAFAALLMPEEKTLFVISYALSAYVAVPVQGDERFAGELVPSMAAAFMPFGVPALGDQGGKNANPCLPPRTESCYARGIACCMN